MSAGILGCHSWVGGCYWHLVVEAKDAAKCPTVYKAAPIARDPPTQMSSVPRWGNPGQNPRKTDLIQLLLPSMVTVGATEDNGHESQTFISEEMCLQTSF